MLAPYGYLVARDGPPEPCGLVADIVLDGGGLYLAASIEHLAVRVRIARADIPNLPVIATGITLRRGPVHGDLWEALVARACAAMPNEVVLAVIARDPRDGETFVASAGPYVLVEPQLDEAGTGAWQPQQTSGCSVRATPIADAIVEVHSHHAMGAYFSPTDDRDETCRRVYGVLGRLNTAAPELALRVSTGCRPLTFEPVPFEHVFDCKRGAFRDVHFETSASAESANTSEHRRSARSPYRLLSRLLLVEMAEDLSTIRALLEASQSARADSLPQG
jgi:Prokaryotic homologs of the JAB domain